MRHLTARLISVLFVGSFALSMFAMLPAKRAARQTCSCPMCRTNASDNHCACCMKSKICTCQVSSDIPDQPLQRAAKLGVLSFASIQGAKQESEFLKLHNSTLTLQLYLPVPTPPPRA